MTSVTYDPNTMAMYVSFTRKKKHIAKTIPLGNKNYLDVASTREPLGLEIILLRNTSEEALDAIVNHGKSKITIIK